MIEELKKAVSAYSGHFPSRLTLTPAAAARQALS